MLEKLSAHNLPARLLLNRFRFVDDSLRKKTAFLDPEGMPLYYYLGQELCPKKVTCIGGFLGLQMSCLILGAKSKEVVLYEQDNWRFARANVKIAGAKIYNQQTWDLALVFADFCHYLDFIWLKMNLNGHLCVVNNKEALTKFAEVKNREVRFVEGRDKVGIIRK